MNIANPEKPERPFVTSCAQDDKGYIICILDSILRDSINLLTTYRSVDYARDINTIIKRIDNEGIGFATMVLPTFFNNLLQVIEGGEPSFPGFKKKPGSRMPVFLNRLTDTVIHHHVEDKTALHCLYMLCVAFKKLKGPYPRAVLSDTLDKFIADDESLLSVSYTDGKTRDILHRARNIINTLFDNVDCGSFMPRPGTGATNKPRKYNVRFQPHVVYDQLTDAFPYPLWFYSNAYGFKCRVEQYFKLARLKYPTSRLKFIHKYVGKPRGICIEENETQWLQQGIKDTLYKHIESHPMTRGRVNFQLQDINRSLALKSSADSRLSTIDMSAASDMIGRDLVFQLFRDTKLLPFLDAVSTRIIEFPKDVRPGSMMAQKFAPMGSAVCFPIMAVVHFALVKAIIQLSRKRNARKQSKHVYVYGDDILAPVEFTEDIFTHLPRFGMRLNKEKSFYKSSFRESCGLHAYKGHEITPVYNNYTLNDNTRTNDSTRLLSTLAKEALYHTYGFKLTSGTVRRHIFKIYGQLPIGKPSSPLLCIKREHAYADISQKENATKRRYSEDFQCFQYKLRSTVQRNAIPVTIAGPEALLRWYTTKAEESSKFVEFDSLKIVSRWFNESDLG